MKRIAASLILLFAVAVFAQTAADYFPQETGYTWRYQGVPLDSLNNPIPGLSFIQQDSFAVSTNFYGKDAELVLSKTGPEQVINLMPFTDSLYYSFEGSEGYFYLKVAGLDTLTNLLDSALAASLLGIIESLQDWYSVYRFAQSVNSSYDVLSHDTVITYGGVPLNLRFKVEGKRLSDENLSTAIGDFTCKKFVQTNKVIYLFLGTIPITILEMQDTTWMAQENWIVKRYAPSSDVDLTFAGGGAFYLPGAKYDIMVPLPTNVREPETLETSFYLYQNYPNPFNPGTKIRYEIPQTYNGAVPVVLKVFDILGNQLAVLVSQSQLPGAYEVTFNAEDLASGIYYYSLSAGKFYQVRKMLLLK